MLEDSLELVGERKEPVYILSPLVVSVLLLEMQSIRVVPEESDDSQPILFGMRRGAWLLFLVGFLDYTVDAAGVSAPPSQFDIPQALPSAESRPATTKTPRAPT